MIRLMALLLALAAPAEAETARLISGEHDDFTRLVVELPGAGGWTLGRTATGYGFATTATVQPAYDLSQVWSRIPRTRLQSISVVPETGVLQVTLACPCHIFPFEYRPGAIVLDIKEGAAPPGSAFEAMLDAASASPAVSSTVATYDWLDRPTAPQVAADVPALPLPLATGPVALDPLREALLVQISRAAAEGTADMAIPAKSQAKDASAGGDLPWSQIRIGEVPGIATAGAGADADSLLPESAACIIDDRLNLPGWGADRPVLDLLAEARQGLFTEIDAVDPKALLHSLRLHLYLGFGAEALQYAELLGADAPEDLVLYRSMARIIEGEQDPETLFAPMLTCDGTAALWAALAHSRLPPGDAVNANAVLRSFAALPPHLRRHFGPALAEKFLDRDDPESARLIRDALERTPDMPQGTVALLEANADLHGGKPTEARDHATEAVAAGDNEVAALITLAEAHFRRGEPLSPEVAISLQAYLGEAGQGADQLALRRALVLALGLSGQTSAAFATAGPEGPFAAELWRVTYQRAADDDFLNHAILPKGATPPDTGAEVATAVAGRLLRLGFADAALDWLGPVGSEDSADRRQLAAAAELARGDARATLTYLAGLSGPTAAELRARALVQIQVLPEARISFDAAGLTEESARLAVWEGDWERLKSGGSRPWAAAAAYVAPPQLSAEGLLARGAALVDDSAAARLAIEELLKSVASPAPP